MTGRRSLAGGAAPDPVARRSAPVYRFMAWTFARFFARHMNALRVARWGRPPAGGLAGPVVVYANHPSWWDAIIYLLCAERFFPGHDSYAPIEAAMLAKYRVFGRMGAFGVELDSRRGAAAFLAASANILSEPNRVLWVAAQGRFSDVRERPLGLKPGVGRLAELAPGAVFLPLAVEIGFWEERGAEALVAFGPALRAHDLVALGRRERLGRLEGELEATLDRLARDVQAREPGRFETLISGQTGIGGVYDAWRRLAAAARGQVFDPSHGGSR